MLTIDTRRTAGAKIYPVPQMFRPDPLGHMDPASDASPQVSSSSSSLTTHPGLQDDTEFELVAGVGRPGLRKWADSWTETVSVLPSDTLDCLFAVTNARPRCLAEVRVAPSVETRRLKLHTRLPHPRPDATLAENGLKQGHVLRWTPGARKD